MTKKFTAGFTLIELMIAVAIVAILAAIAIPSYQESSAKSKRSDAQGALMGFASAMERHYTQNNTYEEAATGGNDTGAPAASLYPNQSPIDGSTKYYDLKISAAASDSYTLTATPIAGGSMAGDRCGTLSLTSAGVKSATEADCWY